jgi:hypothetical protein
MKWYRHDKDKNCGMSSYFGSPFIAESYHLAVLSFS